MAVFVFAYLIGHYWNARIYRNMLIGNHFKIKSSHGSDSESGEENDSSTPSGFRRFGVNYIYIFIEHAVMIVYGLLCCMVSCRDCPFQRRWNLNKKANRKIDEQMEITNIMKHLS
jgi:hypothetical protein